MKPTIDLLSVTFHYSPVLLRHTAAPILFALIAAAVLTALPAESAQHNVPLFISGANNASGQQGFVRIVNHSDWDGMVMVRAIDDTGATFGSDAISLGAYQATHFNSGDLELGNASKGFAGVGSGTGDWRLQIESDLRLEVLAYVRTSDGPLTPIHGEARQPGVWHLVPTFNPAAATRRVSKLRLTNPGEAAASVTIVGVDDAGETSQAAATVAAGRVLTISAQQLESGAGLQNGNGLGDGAGKWRLHVAADVPISVMSLMETATGQVTNLTYSTAHLDPSLPKQITPPRASGGFTLGRGWYSHRIVYAEGEILVALLSSHLISSRSPLVDAWDASGQYTRTMYFYPSWGYLHGLTYGGQGVLYLSNPQNESIMAYSVEGVRSRTIETPWAAYELAFGQGKLFAITRTPQLEIRQLTLAGEEVGTPFPLSTRNENPTGMTYWDDHLYVVDEEKEQVFAYSIASGERRRTLEFELDPDNDVPQGIEYANGRFYVPDTGDDLVYAYTPSGETVEVQSRPAFGRQPANFSQ